MKCSSFGRRLYFPVAPTAAKSFLPIRAMAVRVSTRRLTCRTRSTGTERDGSENKDSWHNGSLDLVIRPDGTLCAAWTEYDGPLWFSRSSDRGESFSKPMRIAGGGEAKPARGPALAAGSEKQSLPGLDCRRRRQRPTFASAKSTDKGRNIRRAGDRGADERICSDAPKLAVDRKGAVHVVYGESSGESFDPSHVRYARSHHAARTFETGARNFKTAAAVNRGRGFSGAGLGRAG